MAFDGHSTPSPASQSDTPVHDPASVELAMKVISGAIKPKARQRVAELLEGLAESLRPDTVVKLDFERRLPKRGTYERAKGEEVRQQIASDLTVISQYFT